MSVSELLTMKKSNHTFTEIFNNIHNIDIASFVVRSKSRSALKVVDDISESIIERRFTSEWPGSSTYNESVLFVKFRFNSHFFNLISKFNNIYDWIEPDLPEDIAFYTKGKLVFYTIAHENEHFYI